MANLKTPDLPLLLVQSITQPPPAPEDLKYDIHYLTPNPDGTTQPTQVNLCGFSFFGEISGLPDDATGGIILLGEDETPRPHPPAGLYQMTFNSYLDQLQAAKINYSRLFLFPLYKAKYWPFGNYQATNDPRNGKYDLTNVSGTFLARLEDFISKARARGIVVCISFFSHQMLAADAWSINPFNYANNASAVYNKDGQLVDEGFINATEGALVKFFEVQPVAANVPYDPTWSHQQKLFWVQRNLVQKVVARTRPYWNVVYELFNEPIIPANPPVGFRALLLSWFGYMAGWVNESLLVNNQRTRLVSLVAGADLLNDLLNLLAPQTGTRLVDIFSFHGLWGGDAGKAMLCNYAHTADRANISDGINTTIRNFPNAPLGLIFDSDALYWAQKNPATYVELLLNKNASFNYRWPTSLINEVQNPDAVCKIVLPLKVGLSQRLSLIGNGAAAAQAGHTITGFPKPPGGIPTNLTAAVEMDFVSGTPLLHLSFNTAAGEHEGYAALFGATPETLGQGTSLLPPVRYFPKAAVARQDFKMPLTLAGNTLSGVVAVAARNGAVVGETTVAQPISLPAPPASAPTGLTVSVEFVNAQTQLRLTFNRPDIPHDGYVALFGPSADRLGTGTNIFPGLRYFPKTDATQQQFLLSFNNAVGTAGVSVAVAACNGPSAGPRSNVVSVAGYDAKIDLTRTSLNVGASATVAKRGDFHETSNRPNHVAFINTGLNRWEWQSETPVQGSDPIKTTLGVYMPVRDMTSGLALLFIPMRPENRPNNDSTPVLPGWTAVINLNLMQLTSTYDSFSGLELPLLLPYSRRPLAFRMGMGTIRTIPGGFAYGHFGEEYLNLPDSARTPIQVSVNEPERQVVKLPPASLKLGAGGFTLPLTSGHDFSQYLASVATTFKSPNTTIRPRILLQNTGTTAAPPSRVLRLELEGGGTGVDINVSAVKLQPVDLYYSGPHKDPQTGLFDVPGGGKTAAGSLERFEGLYTTTAAFSDTSVNPGETITWAVRPGWGTTQFKQLLLTNNAASAARVSTFTVEMWENLTTAEDTQRQKRGELTFNSATTNKLYVQLNDAANTHRYYVATLHADKPALVSYEIVLMAGADGVFKTFLEVNATNFTPPLTVSYKTLEVHVLS